MSQSNVTTPEAIADCRRRLDDQYLAAECLMKDHRNKQVLETILVALEHLFVDAVAVYEAHPDLAAELASVRKNKAEFDDRVSHWIREVNSPSSIALPVNIASPGGSGDKSPRDNDSFCGRSRRSSSSTNSRTRVKVTTQLARLAIQQTAQKQELARQHEVMKRQTDILRAEENMRRAEEDRRRAEEEIRRAEEEQRQRDKMEMLELQHQLQAAEVEEKVWDEMSGNTEYVTVKEGSGESTTPPLEEPLGDQRRVLFTSPPVTSQRSPPDQRYVVDYVAPSKSPSQYAPKIKSSFDERGSFTAANPIVNNICTYDSVKPTGVHDNEIASLVKHINRPKPKVLVFDGNPMDYWKFVRNFDSRIDDKVDDDGAKLSYLAQHCDGKARKLIEHCFRLKVNGYQQARQLLYDHFGKSHIIAHACVRCVVNGPELRPNDAAGLSELAQSLRDCLLTLSDIDEHSEMNNYPTLIAVVNRLPFKMQEAWKRRVEKILRDTGREPLFEHLVDFVETEDRIANSLFSRMLDEHRNEAKKAKGKSSHVKASSHVVVSEQESRPKVRAGPSHFPTTPLCQCCSGNHVLAKCEEFKSLPYRDRLRVTRRRRLCDNCFRFGHFATKCNSPKACTVRDCNEAHHTLLHPPEKREDESPVKGPALERTVCSVVSAIGKDCHASSGRQSVNLMMVAVKVSANGRTVDTYALLDTGSGITLCDKKLTDKLGLQGEPSNVTLKTINGNSRKREGERVNLSVASLDGSTTVELPEVFAVDCLPITANKFPRNAELDALPHIRDLSFPQVDCSEALLLIGLDVPEAFLVQEVRKGKSKQPIAFRVPLGWALAGPVSSKSTDLFSVNFTQVANDSLHEKLERMWKTDFQDTNADAMPMSREDRFVLDKMKTSVQFKQGHYELPLPWRPNAQPLRCNRDMALNRLGSLERRMRRDAVLRDAYTKTVQGYIAKGYAEEVPNEEQSAEVVWYLPHHPVTNPHKPGKVRVVFDCAAKYRDQSLNDALLQGPDLTNSLVGVLSRFRMERVALVADVEAMFHQIRVKLTDCDALRFLWWPDGDVSKKPTAHRMLVHLFGATSSPSCASFCLKQAADDLRSEFPKEVVETVEKNFYVDDCLKSVSTEAEAVQLVKGICALLKKKGFRLTKWLSNSERVLASIDEEERAKSVKELDVDGSSCERVLGVRWNVSSDEFGFNVDVKQLTAYTRRSILSVVSSLYDPLGFAAPVIVVAKTMQRDLCRKQLGWDDVLSDEDSESWAKWLQQLPRLGDVVLPRFVKPHDFGKVRKTELHHFADASSTAYGAVTYLRLVDERGRIHCSFVIGKARVAPLKTCSIPRLELTAAVVAAKLDRLVRKELQLDECQSVFWTDSTAVLQSIRNCNKRFPVFVANRLAKIEDVSRPSQWRHVSTKVNPADEASRGLSVNKFLRSSRWLTGPQFLWEQEDTWPSCPDLSSLPIEFLLIKKETQTVCLVASESATDRLIARYSSLNRLKRAVSWLLRFKSMLMSRRFPAKYKVPTGQLTVVELKAAELEIVKYVQRRSFPDVIAAMSKAKGEDVRLPKKKRALGKLNPILVNGVMRVGGRLERACVEFDVKHPMILPYDHRFTDLVIMQQHDEVGHSGMGHTWSSLRQRYWIIKGGVAVRRVLGKCVSCRRRNGSLDKQMMADLPASRLQANKPPFSVVGVDYFGPFLVKQGRSEVKRYGCIFSCFSTRAAHIEIAHSLSTDSFIGALRRFIGRRGRPDQIYSDNGTNFVGAERILREELNRWNQRQIYKYLQQRDIAWSFNPPTASHMGGVWERMIRSVRKILNALLSEQTLSDEKLMTLMVEVEAILNSRPLVPVTFDSKDEEPLTPNHLLLQRAAPNMSPGLFTGKDCFHRNRWRQVQYLADQFWRRWSREYLPTLMPRSKWANGHSNFTVGDIVLVADDNQPRSKWLLGRVTDVLPDRKGVVRQVIVKTHTGALRRPIAKLCLLCRDDAMRD
uniref:Uncharacterized protein LOC104265735 n=1 Tax=Phallusia mammillata TaxID=59560 RepID=A0A6F9DJ44_9ASCI|nr:uncharacterized protein LOC104265735 [Phallusia mammillata]